MKSEDMDIISRFWILNSFRDACEVGSMASLKISNLYHLEEHNG